MVLRENLSTSNPFHLRHHLSPHLYNRGIIPMGSGEMNPYPFLPKEIPADLRDKSIASFGLLVPRHYDLYPGTDIIPAAIVHVPIVDKTAAGRDVKLIIKMVNTFPDNIKKISQAKRHNPYLTAVIMGGGASDAMAATGLAAYVLAADQQNQTDPTSRVRFLNTITISHPAGAPRTEKHIDGKTMEQSAAIALKAMKKAEKERKITIASGGIVLFGFSSSSPVMIYMAEALGERCRGLVLIDPVGVAEFPDLPIMVVLDGFIPSFKETFAKTKDLSKAAKAAIDFGKLKLTEIYGTPSTLCMSLTNLLALFVPLKEDIIIMERYGFTRMKGGRTLNALALKCDSTRDARINLTMPVIVAGEVYANVANLLKSNLGIELKNLRRTPPQLIPIQLQNRCDEMIKQMFPNSSSTQFIMHFGASHEYAKRDPEFWSLILKSMQNLLYR